MVGRRFRSWLMWRGRNDPKAAVTRLLEQIELERSIGPPSDAGDASESAERRARVEPGAADTRGRSEMILVVGATGMVGREICTRLVDRGAAVRALVRTTSDPSKVAALRELGAAIVEGDLRDAGSLERACTGVDRVITTVSSMPFSYVPGVNDIATTDLAGARALIAAARAAGVGRFVYTSFSGNLDLPMPLRDAKRAIEADLRTSGLTYTILRPSCFMEVWLSPAVGFDPAAGTVTIYGDGTAPISWIAAGDVAEFAVRSLEAPSARNATLELGGPRPISPLEAVTIFERVAGRRFAITHVPEAALAARQAEATDPMAQSFAALMRCYASGDPIPMDGVLAAIPISLTTVEEYADRVLAATPVAVG